MKWIESHNVKRHRSALHSLIHTLEVKPSKIETSIPFVLHPGCSPPFYKSIVSNDKEAIKDFKKNRDKTKVFTDSSSTDGKVGASAVLYVNDTKVVTLHFHLGVATSANHPSPLQSCTELHRVTDSIERYLLLQ